MFSPLITFLSSYRHTLYTTSSIDKRIVALYLKDNETPWAEDKAESVSGSYRDFPGRSNSADTVSLP